MCKISSKQFKTVCVIFFTISQMNLNNMLRYSLYDKLPIQQFPFTYTN